MQGLQTTRRGFLKGAAAAGAAAAGGGLFSTSAWLAPATAQAEPEERKVCTFHQGHCGGRCPVQCTVRDGRLAMFEPNPNIPDRYQTMCLKGVSEIEHVYSPHRVQTPLKRVGERGEGKFESISWDQALDEIAEKLTEIQGKYGKGSVAFYNGGEAYDYTFLPELLEFATFIDEGGVDIGIANGLEPAYGFGDTVAYATQEARDWVNSKLVLVMGSNFLETSLTTTRTWFEAKEAGAKLICIDPNFSTSAGKSDEWIPIEPATDAAFLLGMASVILEEELYDEDFVLNHTSLPFLVDRKTGELLRDEKPTAPYSIWTPDENSGASNPFYMAVDGKPVRFDAGGKPQLSATVKVEGKEYCTAWDLLVENQRRYTPEWAEGICHVPAEKIAEVARLYAEGPSSIMVGWGGNEKFANADIAGHATALVVALTGNIGKKGAGVGCYTAGLWNGYIQYLGYWDTGYAPTEEPTYVDMHNIRLGEYDVHAIVGQGDFTQKFANLALTEEWVKTLDLVMTYDPYFTESARLSDYVLPICTHFENESDFGVVTNGYNSLIMQQKVIDPLFEARTIHDFEQDLLGRMGFGPEYFPKDIEEYNNSTLAAYEDEEWIAKTTHREMVESNCWKANPHADEPRVEFTDRVFYTASGRMDVYYDFLAEADQALPNWVPAIEAYEGNPLKEKYPITFYNAHTRFRIHNQFHNSAWLDEVFPIRIELNPDDMAARGLSTGDDVRVFNDRGSFLTKAVGNPAVRPGTSRMFEGCASRYLGGDGTGGYNSVTNNTVDERGWLLQSGPQTPFSDTLVEVEKA